MSDIVELKDALVVSQNQTDIFGSSAGQFAQGNDSRFPTSDEKAALAGSGTPSASSKYITEDSTKDITAKELLGHSGDVVISGTTLTFENGILKSVAV